MSRKTMALCSVVVLAFHLFLGALPAQVMAVDTATPSYTVTMTADGQPYDGSKMTAYPVTITVSTTKAVEYSTDQGKTWQAYSAPLTATTSGVHQYVFREVGTSFLTAAHAHILPSVAEQAVSPTATTLYVRAAVASNGDGVSWDTAFQDLQSALDAAKPTVASGDSVQIFVAEGTYYPTVQVKGTTDSHVAFQLQNNVAIYGGFSADG